MSEKIVRDPVHDVIAFRTRDALEALLFRLLNAPEFQRLRRIRQLGMATLAYPGAEHSRYSHCLGVMETARKMLNQLALSHTIDDEQRTLTLTAALLHDLGHGPFSHVFERVSGVRHELLTLRVILDPDSHVHRILAGHEKTLPARVAAVIKCDGPRTFINDILCSQLDADRCDYLLRDSLMTGSQYGMFDLTWLMHALTIDTATKRLAIETKGISAVEAYLQSRYHMYRNVYFHKVVRSAEGMVKLALHRARRLAVQDRLDWPPRNHPVAKALLGQQLSMPEFADLDDVAVMQCFKTWRHSGDTQLVRLCNGLLFRRLYKSVDVTQVDDPRKVREILHIAEDVIRQAGGDPHYELFYDQPSDTPYEIWQGGQGGESAGAGDNANEILIRDPAGKLTEFATVSPLVHVLNRQLLFRRIHTTEEWRGMIAKVVGGAQVNDE